MGWYEVYQLLVSSEQQLLTAQPQPSSCFIPYDGGAPAKNANNPELWREKSILWKFPGLFIPKITNITRQITHLFSESGMDMKNLEQIHIHP